MQNETILPGRESVVDRNPPKLVKYEVDKSPKPVRLFTFGPEDDPNIKKSSRPFLLTCAMADYPELRLRFAQLFSAFVARVNHCSLAFRPVGRWNDVNVNPFNPTFQRLLTGGFGEGTDVFIIPLRRDVNKEWLPCGGVKFVTSEYSSRSDMTCGTLNLVSGLRRTTYKSLYLDFYESGKCGNDYVSGVMSI